MGADSKISQLPDHLILFDGVCNLCNSSVNFVVDHDPDRLFSFASLQSAAGHLLVSHFGYDTGILESVMLWEGGCLYRKSRAALEIARRLGGLWPVLYALVIVPPFIRDAVYDFIASNRYKWFGKKNDCRIPDPGLKGRFVESV